MDPAQAFEAAIKERYSVINEAISEGGSEIQNFYENSVIFITGGTGFLGKQLIEKLFRSCNISKIYILIRPKKGKSTRDRFNEVLQDCVYEDLRKSQPFFMDRIVLIEGDVYEINLGMSVEDWKTIAAEVNVIFHVAASTRFDEPLHSAILINVRGTREALCLAKSSPNLRSFVYVSTSFSNARRSNVFGTVEEEFYPPPMPPSTMIYLAEKLDRTVVDKMASVLVDDWPNNYSFTKAIAEDVVRTMANGVPVCIVRPAIVISGFREHPGWLDMSCVYGPSGISLGIGVGVIHTLLVDGDIKIDFVPVDIVNNCIIAAAWNTAKRWQDGLMDTRIYNVTNQRHQLLWKVLSKTVHSEPSRALVSPKTMWYCGVVETKSKVLYFFLSWLLHFIPAYIVDFGCFLTGKKFRLSKIYNKIYRMCSTFEYYLNNFWNFSDGNTQELFTKMSERDRKIFCVDLADIDWTEMIRAWYVGVRKHIIKDGLLETEYGVRKQAFLKILNYILVLLYIFVLYKVFCTVFCGFLYVFGYRKVVIDCLGQYIS